MVEGITMYKIILPFFEKKCFYAGNAKKQISCNIICYKENFGGISHGIPAY